MSVKDGIPTSDEIGSITKDIEGCNVFLSQRNRNILDFQKSKISSSDNWYNLFIVGCGVTVD